MLLNSHPGIIYFGSKYIVQVHDLRFLHSDLRATTTLQTPLVSDVVDGYLPSTRGVHRSPDQLFNFVSP